MSGVCFWRFLWAELCEPRVQECKGCGIADPATCIPGKTADQEYKYDCLAPQSVGLVRATECPYLKSSF